MSSVRPARDELAAARIAADNSFMPRRATNRTPVELLVPGLRLILLRHEGHQDRLRIVRPDLERTVARWSRAGLAPVLTDFEMSWDRRKPWLVEGEVSYYYPTTIYGLLADRLGDGPGISYGCLVEVLVRLKRSPELAGRSVELSWPDGLPRLATRRHGPDVGPWSAIACPATLSGLARALRNGDIRPR